MIETQSLFKNCKKCTNFLPVAMFYKHNGMADGLLSFCKKCVKLRVGKHREKNIEKIREYDRARGSRQGYEYQKKYREKNPTVYRAHMMLNSAIRLGVIRKQSRCFFCNEEKKLVGHHVNYFQPLLVQWLCQSCHKSWHAKNGHAKNHDALTQSY